MEQFKNQPCCRQVASTSALNDRTDTYKSFERALIKAYKFSQDNHEKTISDVKKYIDIDSEFIDYEVYGGHAESNPDPDKQATIALKNKIVEFGYTTDYDIEQYYNTDIYKKALESLISENPDEAIYKDLQVHFNIYE